MYGMHAMYLGYSVYLPMYGNDYDVCLLHVCRVAYVIGRVRLLYRVRGKDN